MCNDGVRENGRAHKMSITFEIGDRNAEDACNALLQDILKIMKHREQTLRNVARRNPKLTDRINTCLGTMLVIIDDLEDVDIVS